MKKIATIHNGKVSDLIEVLAQHKDAEIYICGTAPITVYRTEDGNITIDYDEDLVEEEEEISNKELEKHCVQNWDGAMCHTSCIYKHECSKYIDKYGHTPLFGEEE